MNNDLKPIRVGIVGTGYIAEFHAKAIRAAPGAELVGVADPNTTAAATFAAAWGVPAFPSLEAMAAAVQLDAVHLLVPPDLHFPLAAQALAAGLDVLVEKPMCTSAADAAELMRLSREAGRIVRVNHSMVFGESFARLREHVRRGDLGPLDYVCFNHFAELGFIRFGPFSNWILRQPGNALLEIGSHPVSGMIDLVGEPDRLDVTADRDVVLPGGARAYRRWRIHATAGRTAVDINLDLGPGFSSRTVFVRGALGSAFVDLDADTCAVDRRTFGGIDFDRYRRSLDQSRQIGRQAGHALADYLLTTAKLRKRGNPYVKSILDSVGAFYAELRSPPAADPRINDAAGLAVVQTCNRVVEAASLKPNETPAPPAAATGINPTVLVIGGTGFIGKRLIRRLLDAGHRVRAAGRSISQELLDLGSDRLEIVRADLRSPEDIARALAGIETVYHLVTTDAHIWPEFLEREVEPTRRLGEACVAHGIKRLIFTGTIASFYAGAGAGTITEDTPLDPAIDRRDYYARAKAAAEQVLLELHHTKGLPLVIVRPGIVIGDGGNPFHWGVGYWRSEGACEVWGDGRNPLPFVLVDDVAAALELCMEKPGIDGRSYNLIDAPLISARDYIDTLQKVAGMRIDVRFRPMWSFYLEDLAKWAVKVLVKHPDAARRPSYRDWESRTQKAFYDCLRTRDELGWKPRSDVEALKTEGIAASLSRWLAARGH